MGATRPVFAVRCELEQSALPSEGATMSFLKDGVQMRPDDGLHVAISRFATSAKLGDSMRPLLAENI